MGFILKSYETLKIDLDREVGLLRVAHKGAPSIAELFVSRRGQVQFLYAAIEVLDNYEFPPAIPEIGDPDVERARVLSGFMLTILNQINPYFMTAGTSSQFGKALPVILGISLENQLDSKSAAALLSAALNFFNAIMHTNDDFRPIRADHPFVKVEQIYDYKRAKDTDADDLFLSEAVDLKGAFVKASHAEDKAIFYGSKRKEEEAKRKEEANRKEEENPPKAKSGWRLGGIFGGGTSSKSTTTVKSKKKAGSEEDAPKVEIKDKKALETVDSTSTYSGPG
jgi:hypothetical protein